MDKIDELIERRKAIETELGQIDEYFVEHQNDLKKLFLGKCFIITTSCWGDEKAFLYRVNKVDTDSFYRHIVDFHAEKIYYTRKNEIEVSYRSSDYEHTIGTSHTSYRTLDGYNLYKFYMNDNVKEVSEEEFFKTLEDMGVPNIRQLPDFEFGTIYKRT